MDITDNDFKKSFQTFDINATEVLLNLLSPIKITSFEYRVRAYNSSGISVYSNIGSALITEIQSETIIDLYPNPSNHYIFISGISEPYSESAIIDVGGNETKIHLTQTLGEPIKIDISWLSEGMYFLRIVTSQSVYRFKFLKL